MNIPHISVVIPVFKAASTLDELYNRLVDALETISSNFEIIFVEDCGGDNSWEIIERLARLDSRVRGFQFSRNFGQHYGITAGLDLSQGEWVVVMDCDLQDRPEEIPRLYLKAQEGYDIVLALRVARRDPLHKRFNSWLFYKIFRFLTEIDYDGSSGAFRIMSHDVVNSIKSLRERLRFFGGLVQWVGYKTTSIEVKHDKRMYAKSNYTIEKSWNLAIEALVAYSDKPLRLAMRIGFFMATLSFMCGIYIIGNVLINGSPVPGWSSLMASLYFIGGLILYAIGIIGLYLGKVFDESKRRPLYIIRKST